MWELMTGEGSSRWGNKFGVVLLPVYYHRNEPDPLRFVKRSKAMIDKKKLSLEAPFSYKLMDYIISLFGPKVTSILLLYFYYYYFWKICSCYACTH